MMCPATDVVINSSSHSCHDFPFEFKFSIILFSQYINFNILKFKIILLYFHKIESEVNMLHAFPFSFMYVFKLYYKRKKMIFNRKIITNVKEK